jgi:hypothetical protein
MTIFRTVSKFLSFLVLFLQRNLVVVFPVLKHKQIRRDYATLTRSEEEISYFCSTIKKIQDTTKDQYRTTEKGSPKQQGGLP